MDIIDGVKKLIGPELIRVTSGVQQLQGSAVHGCGAALEAKLTGAIKECDAGFYDACSPKLDEIGDVCPTLGTEITFQRWRDDKLLELVKELKCTVEDMKRATP